MLLIVARIGINVTKHSPIGDKIDRDKLFLKAYPFLNE
ncbi:MAG: hypothetical protein IRF12RH_03335 [Rickettsia helvetica]|uniref:Uncharacterized protein n=1 Tax=Rickettsia helvetica TaxID=35789 RepID=A0ABP0T4M2_RICHE